MPGAHRHVPQCDAHVLLGSLLALEDLSATEAGRVVEWSIEWLEHSGIRVCRRANAHRGAQGETPHGLRRVHRGFGHSRPRSVVMEPIVGHCHRSRKSPGGPGAEKCGCPGAGARVPTGGRRVRRGRVNRRVSRAVSRGKVLLRRSPLRSLLNLDQPLTFPCTWPGFTFTLPRERSH